MNRSNSKYMVPVILAVGIVVGIILGNFYGSRFSGRGLSIINASSNKISDLLRLVDAEYVDKVDIDSLVERSLPNILHELDPHSTYASAEDVESEMQELEGHFSGIGIQFYIFRDTVNVVKVIPGGPSEGCGIKAGDRIVKVDGKPFTGKNVDNDKAQKSLKGPKGSTVKLSVVRPSAKDGKLREFTVTRGDVPVKSIEGVYMLDEQTGYIRVRSFGNTTYNEFVGALAELESQGFNRLVIDLRGNLGGYMETAIMMANEFLPKGRLVVYTEGRHSPRSEYKSDGNGAYQHMPLAVLVDESSASASEIFAGAMQDNDRAQIIGRRTFGKGLVQQPVNFRDGSLVRLTTARYYTPSGRCVQKPYQMGDPGAAYERDLINRELGGELFSADSIKTNGKVYKTVGGRKVYGGGGIIPDIFVPLDTLGYTSYVKEAFVRGLIPEFAYSYFDTHRVRLAAQKDLSQYLMRAGLPEAFEAYAAQHGMPRRGNFNTAARNFLRRYLVRYLVSDVQGEAEAVKYYNADDPYLREAMKSFLTSPQKK